MRGTFKGNQKEDSPPPAREDPRPSVLKYGTRSPAAPAPAWSVRLHRACRHQLRPVASSAGYRGFRWLPDSLARLMLLSPQMLGKQL